MHVYVDRLRDPKVATFDTVVRSFKDFIKITNEAEIAFISLDYEIDERATALDALFYLKDNELYIPFINIHTTNNAARQHMRKIIKKYFPESIITFIKDI